MEVQGKKKEVVVLCSRPPQNVTLGISRCSRAVTVKKCRKKCKEKSARTESLFCPSQGVFTWRWGTPGR